MNLGVTLSDLGEFDEALYYTRESLRLAPDSPDSHVNLGMTLARQGKLDEALESYEQALRAQPRVPRGTAESCLHLAGPRRFRARLAGIRMAAQVQEDSSR